MNNNKIESEMFNIDAIAFLIMREQNISYEQAERLAIEEVREMKED